MNPSFVVAETVRRQHIGEKAVNLRNRAIKLYCFLMSLILFFALVYVWTRVRVVQLGYEVSKLNREIEESTGFKSRLESEVSALKSPTRLENTAHERFGMRVPNADEVVFVEP